MKSRQKLLGAALLAIPLVLSMTQTTLSAQEPSPSPARTPRPPAVKVDEAAHLSPSQVGQDLAVFQQALEQKFSYLEVFPVDYRALLQSIQADADSKGGMTANELGIRLLMVIAHFSDGHARINAQFLPKVSVPFLVGEVGLQVAAFKPDRSGFLDPERPYIRSIDGRPLYLWVRATNAYIAQQSPQWRRFRGLRMLRDIGFLRQQLGLPASNEIRVQLVAEGDKNPRTLTLPLSGKFDTYGAWPKGESRLLPGNIGYLRIPAMDKASAEAVAGSMQKFHDTRGLIIDIRSNGGGSRDALEKLFPYFLNDSEPFHLASVAAFRTAEGRDQDYLTRRSEYPAQSSHFTPDEQAMLTKFEANWHPEWDLPAGKFSPWHYFVLDRRTNPEAYFYDKPAVVLMDYGNFSASDIFLGAFEGWRNVTLMGTPSGGGSAALDGFDLPNSKYTVALGSMASFKPNGLRYDGYGTQPDIRVERTADSYLTTGADNQLEAAIAFLQSGKGRHDKRTEH